MGYVKLFDDLLTSSIWALESDKTLRVWITMLLLKDKNGHVSAKAPGIALQARVTIEDCEEALQRLSSPDRYSKNQTEDGRRILETETGWNVVNHDYYKKLMSDSDTRERWAEEKRRQRKNKNPETCPRQSKTKKEISAVSAHTDTDTDADTLTTTTGDSSSLSSFSSPSLARFSLTSETDKDKIKNKKVYKPTTPPDDFSEKQKAFFQILLDTEFYVPGKGHISGWEAVDDPVRLSKTLGDGITYPLVGPELISQLAAWTTANKNRAKRNIHRFILNSARRNQERGIGRQPSQPQSQKDTYLYGADLTKAQER